MNVAFIVYVMIASNWIKHRGQILPKNWVKKTPKIILKGRAFEPTPISMSNPRAPYLID